MAAGALAFTLVTLPANFVRDRIVTAVKEMTGRDLVIAGGTSFTLFPSLGVSLADVSLSGGPGFESAKPLIAMQSLDASVALWPLLQREVRVRTFVLRQPVFNLEVDADGRRSWDFDGPTDRRTRTRPAQAATETAPDAAATETEPGAAAIVDAPTPPPVERSRRFAVDDVRLEDVRIDNGAISYRDARSGSNTEISAIDAKLALAALAEPLHVKGTLAWKGKTVSFDGALTAIKDVMESRPAKLKLVLGADVLEADFQGSASLHDDLSAEGILSAKSASTRALFRWFGSDLPPSEGFGALTATGLLRGTPGEITYSSAEIALDRTTARGQIGLNTRGARPYVNANLKLTELDLNTYARPSDRSSGRARSIEDLLDEAAPAREPTPPGPRVKGYTKRDGWSDEPFALEGLGALDADAKLSIGKLTVSTIRLDQSDVTVALKNRVMKTTLDDVRLYQGRGQGTVTLDASAGTSASVGANLTLDGISAQPLLRDAADFDRLAGKGRLALALAGQGANERQIVETLNGKVEFAFADGAVTGINVAEMIRGLGKGRLGSLDTAATDKTDFSELTSTWTVKQGIAENQDLKLMSPLLRVSGSGRVELPAREVDYLLRPKLVASIAGQGGARDLSGLEIPVRMHGPWDDPKFTPDLGGIVKDPDKAVGAIREIGKQFKGKKADEIVNDLLGDSDDAKSAKAKGKKLLDQFLNRD